MKMSEWTPEQVDDVMKYGLCRHCGWPRRAVVTEEDGQVVGVEGGCWNENCDPSLIYLGRSA